jgi:cell division FtsZ-interacting protein ZapD
MNRAEYEACRSELARELAMRRNAYPRWVSQGKMSQDKADRQIALLQAVYDEWCAAHLATGEA